MNIFPPYHNKFNNKVCFWNSLYYISKYHNLEIRWSVSLYCISFHAVWRLHYINTDCVHVPVCVRQRQAGLVSENSSTNPVSNDQWSLRWEISVPEKLIRFRSINLACAWWMKQKKKPSSMELKYYNSPWQQVNCSWKSI